MYVLHPTEFHAIVTIDIETATEMGFPDIRTAQEEMLLISVQDYKTKKITNIRLYDPILSKLDHLLQSLYPNSAAVVVVVAAAAAVVVVTICTRYICIMMDIIYIFLIIPDGNLIINS